MNPSRLDPAVFEMFPRRGYNRSRSADWAHLSPAHLDRELLAGAEVLKKKELFTSADKLLLAPEEPVALKQLIPLPQTGRWVAYLRIAIERSRNKPCSFGEHFLDLVMRHYFETDDAAMRSWISHAAPPRIVGGLRPRTHAKTGHLEPAKFWPKLKMVIKRQRKEEGKQ
ncbi:hypothetical protein VTI74DRAFT_7321 [Chaetomium olivicolor]